MEGVGALTGSMRVEVILWSSSNENDRSPLPPAMSSTPLPSHNTALPNTFTIQSHTMRHLLATKNKTSEQQEQQQRKNKNGKNWTFVSSKFSSWSSPPRQKEMGNHHRKTHKKKKSHWFVSSHTFTKAAFTSGSFVFNGKEGGKANQMKAVNLLQLLWIC